MYDWEEASELKMNDRLAVALGWPENYEGSSDISTLEAWALGAWAGDGDCTHFRLINPDKPVIEKMRGFLEGIGSGLKSTYSTRQKEAGKDLYQDPIEHSITGKGKRKRSRERFVSGSYRTQHNRKREKEYWKGVDQGELRAGNKMS